MPNTLPHSFRNQAAGIVRVFFFITALFWGPAIVCGVMWAHYNSKGIATNDGTPMFCAVMTMVLGAMGTAMFLAALMTIPAARRTKKALASFETGDFLAHWEYPDAFWRDRVTAGAKNANKQAWGIFTLLMLFFVFVGMMPVWASRDVHQKIGWSVVVVLICGALAWAGRWATFRVTGAKQRRMLAYPEAFLGKQAVYCAGETAFWGTRVRALQSIRVLGTGEIEVVVGMTKGLKRAVGAVDAVNAAMLHPTYSAQTQRLLVPVPPGEEKRAAEIVSEIAAAMK